MNKQAATKSLLQLKRIMDKNGVKFWLDSGTLLGIVREGCFISGDNDIDIGIWKEDEEKFDVGGPLYSELEDNNYDLYFLNDKIVIEKDSIPINASVFFVRDGEALREKYLLHGRNKIGKILRMFWWLCFVRYYGKTFKKPKTAVVKIFHFIIPTSVRKILAITTTKIASRYFDCSEIIWSVPIKFFKNFSELEFAGDKFMVPKEVEKYLEFHYGADWRTPKKEWSALRQDGAVHC